jgi:hypothetical protein
MTNTPFVRPRRLVSTVHRCIDVFVVVTLFDVSWYSRCIVASSSSHPILMTNPVAKVTRDATLRNYALPERQRSLGSDDTTKDNTNEDRQWGCGYPSDAYCKTWVERHFHPVFGFPEIVRFSWAPAKKLLLTSEDVAAVKFAADDDDEDNKEEDEQYKLAVVHSKKRQRQQMKAFLSTEPKRLPYFQRRGLQPIVIS